MVLAEGGKASYDLTPGRGLTSRVGFMAWKSLRKLIRKSCRAFALLDRRTPSSSLATRRADEHDDPLWSAFFELRAEHERMLHPSL